jgi:hypothetical protein
VPYDYWRNDFLCDTDSLDQAIAAAVAALPSNANRVWVGDADHEPRHD